MLPNTTTPDVRQALADRVTAVSEDTFEELALDIFRYQFTENPVYQEYCRLLGKNTENVRELSGIPFLPISLFKTRDIRTNVWEPQIVFESSRTTGQSPSKHAVRDLQWYLDNTIRGFNTVVGASVSSFRWLALLPSYVERPNASLVAMAEHFIRSGQAGGRFTDMKHIRKHLGQMQSDDTPLALISVSFALMDIAMHGPVPIRNAIVIETGGMKGRRKEPTRTELHEQICESFGIDTVYSEYGMTELLSQGWSKGQGLFHSGPPLRLFTREISDPTALQEFGFRGPLNCIDLANLDTCAFIATEDVGVVHTDGSFEVYGRLDASELRGCNLMYTGE